MVIIIKCTACLENKGDAFEEKITLASVKHSDGAMVLWCCAAANATRKTAQINKRMDPSKYPKNLEANVTVKKLMLKRG